MAAFVILANFTDQGIRNVKDSPDRLVAVRSMAENLGVSITGAHYTVGAFDIVLTAEGPEDAMMSLLLKIGSLGNVRTQSLRAYSPDEMRELLSKMP
jgi:uncharacterized protein with GYD domain